MKFFTYAGRAWLVYDESMGEDWRPARLADQHEIPGEDPYTGYCAGVTYPEILVAHKAGVTLAFHKVKGTAYAKRALIGDAVEVAE